MGDDDQMENTLQQSSPRQDDIPKILDYVNESDMLKVNILLRGAPEQVNAVSPAHGWTPLHVAVMRDDHKMADILLRHGADVNAQNNRGRTALHDAAGRGQERLVKLLLENGADPSLQYKGKTAKQRAEDNGHAEVAALL